MVKKYQVKATGQGKTKVGFVTQGEYSKAKTNFRKLNEQYPNAKRKLKLVKTGKTKTF